MIKSIHSQFSERPAHHLQGSTNSSFVISCGARMASSSSSNRPSQRSKLLNDYLNNRTANPQLTDLGKHAVAFALDPRAVQGGHCWGERFEQPGLLALTRSMAFIQQKLARANPTETAQLVDALRGHVVTLAQQMYGSHVIRAALESGDKTSQMEIINEILTQVISLSIHKYGCWVIQSVLKHCTHKRLVLEHLHANVLIFGH
uniref:PUM-HD domain-containing protein n=1 Tax=Globodera rostochiensis TaxID=31243 RepID=A0A914I401_GLORO